MRRISNLANKLDRLLLIIRRHIITEKGNTRLLDMIYRYYLKIQHSLPNFILSRILGQDQSAEPRYQIARRHNISLGSLYNLRSRYAKKQEAGSAAKFVEVTPGPDVAECLALEGLQEANFKFKEYSIELRGKFPHKILLDILQIPEAASDV